jgi:hypothetical protein
MTTICINQMIAELRAELSGALLTRGERRQAQRELEALIGDKRHTAERDALDCEGINVAVALLPGRGAMSG